MIDMHPHAGFYPMFQRYFDAGLAQASYLLACDRTREAVLIDPRRDVDVYVAAAAQSNLKVIAAIETHVHADFVSGARELQSIGVQTLAGPGSSLRFPAREVKHNERLVLGDLSLRFLHTPGHTPEHISIVAENRGEPARVFTGDTLFVGAVGRPDLLGASLMRGLAGQLHDSLFHTLLALDDEVQVHPGHGAGSLCGAGIGVEPFSTIGRERASNPLLAYADRDQFVEIVLGDLPETPPYFARMKRLNCDGPHVLDLARGYRGTTALDLETATRAVREGAVPMDLCDDDAVCGEHLSTSLRIAFGPKIGYWAGWVLPAASRILLLTPDPARATEAGRQLLRVGFDAIEGYVAAPAAAWNAAGFPVTRVTQISVAELRERFGRGRNLTLIDVRSEREWNAGHATGAIHVPLGDVTARSAEFDKGSAIATICEGGYRSMLAASILMRAGFPNVLNVAGGMAAYRKP
ncbi:MAG TPA: MBL fold metallo-hydrolase [Vicinamibacterales bacterium]|nr:MBL fold metallo-hydrolase [Vicinamibacterales bacterium]